MVNIMARLKQIFRISVKVSLVLVALAEAALIFMADFSGYMFDVVILSLAMGMTVAAEAFSATVPLLPEVMTGASFAPRIVMLNVLADVNPPASRIV